MKISTKVGRSGVAVLLAGLVTMVYPSSDTRVVTTGVWIQVVAFGMFIFAALRGSIRWLFALLLVPIVPIFGCWRKDIKWN
jgi:hypothetical protein